MGFLFSDLDVAKRTYGLGEMAALLEDHGITYFEIEFEMPWWDRGPRRLETDIARIRMLRMAEVLGAFSLKVGPDETRRTWSSERWAEDFARLAGEAEDVGARLALEHLPWANIPTLKDALRLVEVAGHPNGGLAVDAWHLMHSASPLEALAVIPHPRLVSVELSDGGPRLGGVKNDSIEQRRYCGEGELRLQAFVDAIRRAGYAGPWAVKILSREHRNADLYEALSRAADTTGQLLGLGPIWAGSDSAWYSLPTVGEPGSPRTRVGDRRQSTGSDTEPTLESGALASRKATA